MAASQPAKAEGVFDAMTNADNPENDDTLAAEYVLHLLDTHDRRQFEDQLLDDTVLRARVSEWEAHFAAIADEVIDVAPPIWIKQAVLARTSGSPVKSRLRRWMIAIAGGAVAAAVVLSLIGPVLRDANDMGPQFRTELASGDGTFVLVAQMVPARNEIIIERVSGTPPAGRSLELWLIAEGSSVPVSLGILDSVSVTRVQLADDIAPDVLTGTIAISDEPLGGSPTGGPTGTVLATGVFEDI